MFAILDGGGALALYVGGEDRDNFRYEWDLGPDRDWPIGSVSRENVKDLGLAGEVALGLLDGKSSREVLTGFQPTPLGEGHLGSNKFSYYLADKDPNFRVHGKKTFHIGSDCVENFEEEAV